jgi:uncharacterized cupin superfamily protein
LQNDALSLKLFAFDKGEEISSHESNGDVMVIALEGEGEITISESKFVLKKGQYNCDAGKKTARSVCKRSVQDFSCHCIFALNT